MLSLFGPQRRTKAILVAVGRPGRVPRAAVGEVGELPGAASVGLDAEELFVVADRHLVEEPAVRALEGGQRGSDEPWDGQRSGGENECELAHRALLSVECLDATTEANARRPGAPSS